MNKIINIVFLLIIFLSGFNINFVNSEELPTNKNITSLVDNSKGEIVLSKYHNEVSLKISQVENPLYSSKDDLTAIYSYKDYDIKYYEIENGYEYEFILKNIPKTNIFNMVLESKGLIFYKQPPLNETYKNGFNKIFNCNIVSNETHVVNKETGLILVYLPKNCVNSYAVYGSKTNDVYGTGKIFQIYRPIAIDAKGNKIYGDLLIKDNILSVTVNSKWLNEAVYPVIIDPTFGSSNVGSSWVLISWYDSGTDDWNRYFYGSPYSTNATKTIVKFYAYVSCTGSYGSNIQCGVYDTDGDPKKIQSSVGSSSSGTGQWIECNTNLSLDSGSYIFGFTGNPKTKDDIAIYGRGDYKSTAMTGIKDLKVSYSGSSPWTTTSGLPTTFTTSSVYYVLSIYCIYSGPVSIIITSNYTGSGYVKVDNTAYSTPHTFNFTSGDIHLLEALTPVSISTYEQKVFVSWSNSGARKHNYTTPYIGETITATYKTQYKHILDSSPIQGEDILKFNNVDVESPHTSDFIDSGSPLTIYAYSNPSNNTNYGFNYWNNDAKIARNATFAPISHQVYNATYFSFSGGTTGGNNYPPPNIITSNNFGLILFGSLLLLIVLLYLYTQS